MDKASLDAVRVKGADCRRVTVVVISDTHGMHRELSHPRTGDMPEGDILIHCGDMVQRSDKLADFEDFNRWLGSLPYKHKVVIAGNHEYAFSKDGHQRMAVDEVQALLSNAIYLQDSAVTLEGLTIHGSPWNTSHGMAFSESRKTIGRRWDLIPPGVDVLVTHMPPYKIPKAPGCPPIEDEESPEDFARYMDIAANMKHWGCRELRRVVSDASTAPRVHCFGHVHEGAGWGMLDDKRTLFINAAQKEYYGGFLRGPWVFEIVPLDDAKGGAEGGADATAAMRVADDGRGSRHGEDGAAAGAGAAVASTSRESGRAAHTSSEPGGGDNGSGGGLLGSLRRRAAARD